MKISGTKAYSKIETDEYTCVFGGELCEVFSIYPLDVRWEKLPGDGSEVTVYKVIRDVWKEYKGRKAPVTFDYYKVKELLEVLDMIPDRIGTVTDIREDGFVWLLPNGIVVRVYVTGTPYEKSGSIMLTEWYVGYSYIKAGKEIQLTHSHLNTHEVFEELVDIQDGNTFWVVKTNVFGKESDPKIMDKERFDKIKNKNKYRII